MLDERRELLRVALEKRRRGYCSQRIPKGLGGDGPVQPAPASVCLREEGGPERII